MRGDQRLQIVGDVGLLGRDVQAGMRRLVRAEAGEQRLHLRVRVVRRDRDGARLGPRERGCEQQGRDEKADPHAATRRASCAEKGPGSR